MLTSPYESASGRNRAGATDAPHGRHLAREYLQARILSVFQQRGAMVPLALRGGAALRFLYQIPRYSKDLDFALERAADRYDFRAHMKTIRSTFAAETYSLEMRLDDREAVHSAFVRFQGLAHKLQVSPHPDETLSIRLEVDTNPPAGAGLETTIIRRHEVLHLQHHDKASLFAGKLHAILQRPFAKGRDLYDLLWYLSSPDSSSPNLTLLNNALQQTKWSGERLTPENWRAVVRQRLDELDWDTGVAEVRPFLMEPAATRLLTKENVSRLLSD